MGNYQVTVTTILDIDADNAVMATTTAYHYQAGHHPKGVMQVGAVIYEVQFHEGPGSWSASTMYEIEGGLQIREIDND